MDCFFVSVVIRDRPDLKGKPVAVSHAQSRLGSTGEVSSCNYEARRCGVVNGMWMGQAKQKCPDLTVLAYDFEQYEIVAQQVYAILFRVTDRVQAVSCDEAYMDVRGVEEPLHLAESLRRQIFEATACTASIGIGPNQLLARIATKKAKPNGLHVITAETAMDALLDLPVEELPGVGSATASKLNRLGLTRCGDLCRQSKEFLQGEFGLKTGLKLWQFARGEDPRDLQLQPPRKSIGVDVNWGVRFSQAAEVIQFLDKLSDELAVRAQEAGVQGAGLTLKLRRRAATEAYEPAKFMGSGMCDSFTKTVRLSTATNDAQELGRQTRLLYEVHLKTEPAEIRGLGLQLTRIQATAAQQQHPTANNNTMLKMFRNVPRIESVEVGDAQLGEFVQYSYEREEDSEEAEAEHAPTPRVTSVSALDLYRQTLASSLDPMPPVESIEELAVEGLAVEDPKLKGGLRESPARGSVCSLDLTMSQVDPSVLSELPEDIRKEMQQALEQASRRRRRDTTVDAKRQEMRLDEPLRCSQIDSSVLEELPSQMRLEVVRDLKWQQEHKQRDIDARMELNQRGSKRQRVRQMRIDSFHTLQKVQRSAQQAVDRDVLGQLPLSLRLQVASDLLKEPLPANPLNFSKHVASELTDTNQLNEEPVSQQSLEDVELDSVEGLRLWLGRWMCAVTRPERVHLDLLCCIIDELVSRGRLEQVVALLRFLLRQASAINLWEATVKQLVLESQRSITTKYGAPLLL
eukprot:GILJ01008660.1.p1 GENE.GILJ01008660.1~~GILJ01008660.1.p1  ORF type:complete len:744 (-),score=139.86 GILJ01008660.1:165-2396(-)